MKTILIVMISVGLGCTGWSSTGKQNTPKVKPAGAYNCLLEGAHRPNHNKFVANMLDFQSLSPGEVTNTSKKHVFKNYAWNGRNWEGRNGALLEQLVVTGPQRMESKLFISSKAVNAPPSRTISSQGQQYTLIATSNCTAVTNNQ